MEYKDFNTILSTLKDLNKKISELYDIGFDFFEGKYKIVNEIETIKDTLFETHYDDNGVEWINWFIYENDYGERKLDATDENGKPICYSVESLWEYLNKNHKLLKE